ncbi:hypothetical protein ACFLYR_06140 [Chloroflexota bacterium]
MKKLTKLHTILVALLVAVLAISAYFSFSCRGAEAKQPDIRDEINQAVMRLAVVQEENNPEPLKQQLSELNATFIVLSKGKILFPKTPATVEIGNLIVESTKKLELTLLKISPNDQAGSVTIESAGSETGNKYNKAEYKIKVKGDLGRISSLVGQIEGAEFATLTVEDIDVSFKQKKEEDHTFEWWDGEFTVVTLYQYVEDE